MLYQYSADFVALIIVQNIIFVSILLLFFKFLYRKAQSKVVFTVVFLMSIMFAGVAVITAFQYTVFENNIITTVIFAPIIVVLVVGIIYFTTKIIDRQYSKLEQIIDIAQTNAINVSNISTELAASSNEVNAASEEIASTTQEISNEATQMLISSEDIRKIMGLIVNISIPASFKSINSVPPA